ncbi:MAG TPA: Hsp20/alpha crystallin family protein [Candidatus Polarisedimenticolaceae bacterium]|nr:Hsp20/alpha crystallin family protein [Candidatus Polarisedimenticolaceae bacterium]
MSIMKEATKKEMTQREKQPVSGAESTRPGRVFTPVVDIYETDGAITLLADMPGVTSEGLAIDLRDNVLTIDGSVDDVGGPNEVLLLREYDTGAYRREFRLTNLIDQARIEATLKDGVLKLTLPKAEAARPRRIEVKTR